MHFLFKALHNNSKTKTCLVTCKLPKGFPDKYNKDIIRKLTDWGAKKFSIPKSAFNRREEVDKLVSSYIEENPEARILNIGCGFCTRFYRLDNGRIKWIDADFKEVIDIRKFFAKEFKLAEEDPPRHTYLILDIENEIKKFHSIPKDLVIAEGIFPFLTKEKIEQLLGNFICIGDIDIIDQESNKQHKFTIKELESKYTIHNTINFGCANKLLLVIESKN